MLRTGQTVLMMWSESYPMIKGNETRAATVPQSPCKTCKNVGRETSHTKRFQDLTNDADKETSGPFQLVLPSCTYSWANVGVESEQ